MDPFSIGCLVFEVVSNLNLITVISHVALLSYFFLGLGIEKVF